MKNLLLIAACLLNLMAHAQYFQRYYNQNIAGFIRNEIITDGLRSNYNGTLPNNYQFLTTGYSEMTQGIPASNPTNIADRVRYIRANPAGNPLTNRGYHLFQSGNPANIYHAHGRGICEEIGNSAGTRITGDVQDNPFTGAAVPGGSDVLFAKIQLNGVMANQKRYDFGGYDVGTDIKASTNMAGTYLITGYSSFPLTNTNPVLMRVSATGVPVWQRSYDLDPTFNPSAHFYAQSVVEEPGTGNICVVGYWNDNQGPFNSAGLSIDRGFAFLTDPMGNLLWQWSYDAVGFGFGIRFRSVRTDAAGNFLIGGDYDDVFIQRMFGININPAGMINWMTVPAHFTTAGTTASARCFDMIERINTANQTEYYMSGPVFDPNTGTSLTAVTKCGPFGMPMQNFYYANSYHINDGFKIDTVGNTMFRPGFVVFSNTQFIGPSPNSSYIVKAYYDGHTCPMWTPTPPIALTYPVVPMPLGNIPMTHNSSVVLGQAPFNVYTQFLMCNAANIPGASNAKLSGDEVWEEESIGADDVSDLTLYPNPVSVSQQLTLSIDMEQSGSFDLMVYDLSGRLVLKNETFLNIGSNEVKVDVSQISSGSYILVLTNGSDSMRERFVRQ